MKEECIIYCREPELENSKVCCFNCPKRDTCISVCEEINCINHKYSQINI